MKLFRTLSLFCLGLTFATAQAQQAADLPDTLSGTYALEQYNQSNPASAVGRMTLVIDGSKNTLCLNGIQSKTIVSQGNGIYAVTPNSGTSYKLVLLVPADTFHEIVFGNALYRGARKSTSVDCIKETFPVTADKAVQGTYSFKFVGLPAAGLPATGEGTLVVGEKQLCINGLTLAAGYYPAPVDKDGAATQSTWMTATKDYVYVVSSVQTTASDKLFNEVAVLRGIQLRQVVGGEIATSNVGAFNTFVKVSDATSCTSTVIFGGGNTGTGTTAPTLTANEQSIFDLAAELIPSMFAGPGPVSSYQGYTYRFFAASGIYIGLKDGRVYALGGSYGTAITELGTTDSVLKYLQGRKK